MDQEEAQQEMDREEAQQLVDNFSKTRVVLSSKMRSRLLPAAVASYRRLALRMPEIEVTQQMDWREVGKKLREFYIVRTYQGCNCWWCSQYQNSKRGRRENYWVDVVARAITGDPSALVEHLHSRRTLDRFDRIVLADLLDAAFKGVVQSELHRTGRPKELATHSCASTASRFYKDWKAINKSFGIRDWGHSDEMKDEACRVAIESLAHRMNVLRPYSLMSDHPLDVEPQFDTVRELMDRSRADRDSRSR
jgi:hypothetical protein